MRIPDRFIPRFYKRAARTSEIAAILAKHGFYYLVEVLELTRYLPRRLRAKITSAEEFMLPLSIRIRKLLEELGPTYIKGGQIMSSRPDIFPPDILKELSKLQDEVPPFPFEEAQAVIEKELKKPMDILFKYFAPVPIASASIGQVHEAILADGREVIVKVQRPKIDQVIFIDTDIMHRLAAKAEKRLEWAKLYNLVERVEEFTKIIRLEMDYITEGKNADRFQKNFADDDSIHIPAIYWEYTTKKVLTMEYIHGIKIKEKDKLLDKGYSMTDLAEIIGNAYVKQILIDGFFHGDPHFGNIFVMEGQKVALIDFGMAGIVDPVMKKHMAKYFISIVHQDAISLVEVLNEIAYIDPATDQQALTREVGKMMAKYADVTIGQIRLEDLVIELFQLGIKYKITMPGEFTLMDKTLITLEGLGRHLDPSFDLLAAAEPVARRLFQTEFDPKNLSGGFLKSAIDVRDMLEQLPKSIRKISKKLETGEFKIKVENTESAENIKKLIFHIHKASNKLSLSIVFAGILIAFSKILIEDIHHKIFYNISLYDIVVFVLFLIVLNFFTSLWRSKDG